jgi:two-component system, NarL family, nitrate/nitrite response regulator NarL
MRRRAVTGHKARGIATLVVGDIRLYREGIAGALALDERIRVVGTERDAEAALEHISHSPVDIVLIDIAMPGSLEAIRALSEVDVNTKVVALALRDTDDQVIAGAEAGVSGWLSAEASLDELVATLESVMRGEVPCSPRIAANLVNRLATLSSERNHSVESNLTSREREVAELINEGLTNREIADRLYVEESTVKNHVHSILKKLRVRRRYDVAGRVRRRPW